MSRPPPSPPLLLFVVTEDWYFWSHRLPMARAARDAGFAVAVATRAGAHAARIEAQGIRVIPLRRLERRSMVPWRELAAIAELVGLYRRERPALVHHVALKPVLYGALAARLAGVPAVVNALAGLGFVFASGSWKARLLRPPVLLALRLLLDRSGSRALVQNPDDRAALVERHLVRPERVVLIPGSGVDVARFHPRPEPAGPFTVLLAARMVWDKGVGELVDAVRLLRQRGREVRLLLAGEPDPANPRAIPAETLRRWNDNGDAEVLGRCDDMPARWAACHVAALPSYYGEGIPLALLEAAASGRPLVAADAPGGRTLVADGVNGLLVPPRDPAALADALETLAQDPALRARLGAAARRQAEETYAEPVIAAAVGQLYRALVAEGGQ